MNVNDSGVQNDIEISAIVDEYTYLDVQNTDFQNKTMGEILTIIETDYYPNMDKDHRETFQLLKQASESNSNIKSLVLKSQSCLDNVPTDDPIQAVAFVNESTSNREIYVSYRGTGNGRWTDDAVGIIRSSECQKQAAFYFDDVCDQLGITSADHVVVGGHSKGGNEAYYVNYFSKNNKLIDECIPIDGEGFAAEDINRIEKMYSGSELKGMKNRIISINGNNDPVNPLGEQILSENEKFYIKQGEGRDSLADIHTLEALIGTRDADGNVHYDGIKNHFEKDEKDNLENGKPGYFPGFSAELYQRIKSDLSTEDYEASVVALMSLVDIGAPVKIGSHDVSATDYIHLLARGLPIIIETLLLTKDGRGVILSLLGYMEEPAEVLAEDIKILHDYYAEKYGDAAASILIYLIAVAFTSMGIALSAAVTAFIIELVKKLEMIFITFDNFIMFLEFANTVLEKVSEFINKHTTGYKVAEYNTHIHVDTGLMRADAEKLKNAFKKIYAAYESVSKIDFSITDVGIKLKLSYYTNSYDRSYLKKRQQKFVDYLNTTAFEVERVDNEMQSKLNYVR